ncbi:hypothetical protein HNR62_003206 [Oceanisphaera litoralis]|uniref:hypothetical protein n=1 Tax=Oceanisphaera litoralis TaxID=225144 RepID=UPI0019599206|nr:hypothetical protein [Oceanisphaera litoralis]MBM7457294.1 hypothetical protein [Oceanisphaera litoralis]
MNMIQDKETGFVFSSDATPADKIFFLASHIDHIGKTTEQFELVDIADAIIHYLEQACPSEFEEVEQ